MVNYADISKLADVNAELLSKLVMVKYTYTILIF